MQDVTQVRAAAASAVTATAAELSGTVPPNSPEFPAAGDRLNEPALGPVPVPPISPRFPIQGDRLDDDSAPSGDPGELTDRQRAAIELLVLGKATGAVARELEIDRKTLFNWRKLERFDRELNSRRREVWDEAGLRVGGMVHRSLDVIEAHLHDRYDRSRFCAATAILRLSNLGKSVPLANDGGVK